MKKNSICYFVFDVSGSATKEKRVEYKKIYDACKGAYSRVKVISHTTEGKFTTIEDVLENKESGGTYISSGVSVAMNDMIKVHNSYDTIGLCIVGDGDNWAEDNDVLVETLEICHKYMDDFGFYEIFPNIYSTPISELLKKKLDIEDKHFMTIKEVAPFVDKYTIEIKVTGFKVTTAKIKDSMDNTIGKGKATLCPEDKFDSKEGIRIATLRALGLNPFEETKIDVDKIDFSELKSETLNSIVSKGLKEMTKRVKGVYIQGECR